VPFCTKQHDANCLVVLSVVESLGRRPVHGVRECVLLFRPGKNDFQDGTVLPNFDVFGHWSISLTSAAQMGGAKSGKTGPNCASLSAGSNIYSVVYATFLSDI